MHPSATFLRSVIERARFLLSEPEADKYDDAYIARAIVPGAYEDVIGRINLSSDNPIIIHRDISLVAGTEIYALPPVVERVYGLYKLDSNKNIVSDFIPSGFWAPYSGQGWDLQGNEIRFNPIPQTTETWTLIFAPSGNYLPHVGDTTGNRGTVTTSTTFTLPATPSLGLLDLRANAFVGQTLRIITATSWQERIITAYDASTRVLTLRTPITGISDATSDISYEIAPPLAHSLWNAVAGLVAFQLGVSLNMTVKKGAMIDTLYHRDMKTITDRLANLNLRNPKSYTAQSVNNPDIYESR